MNSPSSLIIANPHNYYYNIIYNVFFRVINTMISFILPSEAQQTIAKNLREQRLALNLTQAGLATRSGVPLATVRKFEQHGTISLESFVKLLTVLRLLQPVVRATEGQQGEYTSIEQIIELDNQPKRKRGRRT